MSQNEDTIFEIPPQQDNYGNTYTAVGKALRDKFVKEYFVDFDSTAAAGRIGYPAAIQKEYGNRLMQEPYVLQQISIKQKEIENGSLEEMRQFVILSLRREASLTGPGTSQSARVAALDKLASIYGLHAPTKSQQQMLGPDGKPLEGVFVVPGIMSDEQWEAAAAKQQETLTSDKTLINKNA